LNVFSSSWSQVKGGVIVPGDFLGSADTCGLKTFNKKDIALILAPEQSSCAGVFTKSKVRSACIDLNIKRITDNPGKLRAIFINSGYANACTGKQGLVDAMEITTQLAKILNIEEDSILICSTGVIGQKLPMDKILPCLPNLVSRLGKETSQDIAESILTTDLTTKEIVLQKKLGDQLVNIGGVAKGSGMIYPNMATMLSFLTCDAFVEERIWQSIIQKAVAKSFNAISVDGDTSPNDSFIAFSSGQTLSAKYLKELEEGVSLACQYLAMAIARDGEGANCLIEIEVRGTGTEEEAITIARQICNSSLVKTAIHGCDPNWGRIIAALGNIDYKFNFEDVNLFIGPYQLMKNGEPILIDQTIVSQYMRDKMNGQYLKEDIIQICLEIGNLSCSGKAWGCDLSDQYIRINADYTT
tara:strand:+ start:12790 stop:14028 length:1239 start_codon:yes stop_codon:yes gene_type:complete